MDPKRFTVHMLVCFFGMGSWIAINGVWVELPILVIKSPEQWNLPSTLAITTQLANISPLLVTLVQIFRPKMYNRNLVIYSVLTVGLLSTLLLTFLCDKTAHVGGREISLALYILYFALACVDCTSSVTFLPFTVELENSFLTTFFIGEGLSGVFPSVVALLQGAGKTYCVEESTVNVSRNQSTNAKHSVYEEPRFSEKVFFGFVFLMMLLCSISFVLLNTLSFAKQCRVCWSDNSNNLNEKRRKLRIRGKEEKVKESSKKTDLESSKFIKADQQKPPSSGVPSLNNRSFFYLLCLVLWANIVTNGVLPSISSYTCIPYGQTAYHFAITLGNLANPLACFLAMFVTTRHYQGIGCWSFLGTAFGIYLFYLALQSPCPPLVNSFAGPFIMVLSFIAVVAVLSYVKVTIGQIFRERGSKQSLLIYGAVVQLGSFLGALTMFLLLQCSNYVEGGDICTTACH
ncbi:unnamed protein product [Clavelina lepadiformis]|uniref:Riboflavin transporter n=1 Tax=Clavelina lepadiformis TaxID=159417 RepID=A0ABP0F9E1_CLALP